MKTELSILPKEIEELLPEQVKCIRTFYFQRLAKEKEEKANDQQWKVTSSK